MFLILRCSKVSGRGGDHPVDAECSYLPRPGSTLALRKVSEKIGLQLPYGTMTFTLANWTVFRNTSPVR